jgi:hypothetical protein
VHIHRYREIEDFESPGRAETAAESPNLRREKIHGTKYDPVRLTGRRKKMKCSDARNVISPYIDDELPPHQKSELLDHIESCQACREELTALLGLHGLFAGAERFDAPPGFVTRVMAGVETHVEERNEPWFVRLGRSVTGRTFFLRVVEVAFALVVVVIGFMSGTLLTTVRSGGGQPTVSETFSLDLFKATPPNSVGGAYMRLAGAEDER